jgi:benzodiazapine receptor
MDSIALNYRNPRTLVITLLFIGLVVGVGAVIGTSTAPDAWYTALEKPPFNPPNWIFGPVWFSLYVLIGIAGARTFLRDPTGPAMMVWGGQMLLNWAWSPTWFALHLLWPAFALIASILVLIVLFIAMTWKTDRPSALMFLPYAAWVAFASTLNLSIAILN